MSEFHPTPEGVKDGAKRGPSSNTGQNSQSRGNRRAKRANPPRAAVAPNRGGAALVDFLSVTIPNAPELIAEFGEGQGGHDAEALHGIAAMLVRAVLGRGLTAPDFEARGFNGYSHSAPILSSDGERVGTVAIGGNRDTAHITLPGSGCAHVSDWNRVAGGIATLAGRLTRVDLAWDDYSGELFRLDEMHALGEAHAIRAEGPGRAPKTRFLDDHGHGTGRTLYAGAKGAKELCIYEKGKQLGDPSSPWVRCEVRWWGKHAVLPLEMLTAPVGYLRAAYNVCARISDAACERVKTTARTVEAKAVAWCRWLQTQVGGSFHLLQQVFQEQTHEFLSTAIARNSRPGRFRGFNAAELVRFIREGLNHDPDRRNPLGLVPA